jgi:tRNA dimethylallyltransferase
MRAICVTGPTSSGKTALALFLARALGGEIVNADARQLYRDAPIGTGVPSEDMRATVPHHLFAVSSPEEVWTAARWCEAAHVCVREIFARHCLPIVVGGTGLYVRAFTEGYVFSGEPDASLRAELLMLSTEKRVERLLAQDSSIGARVDLRNPHRVLRALERMHVDGVLRPMCTPSIYTWTKLAIAHDQDELRARITKTVREQLSRGWVKEVRVLLDQGVSPHAPLMTSIGFRAIASALSAKDYNDIELERLVMRDSWHYARRQRTWFRKEPHLFWVRSEAEALDILRSAGYDMSHV